MRKILSCTLVVLSVLLAFSQKSEESVQVYFNISKWQFEPTRGSNATSMDEFIDKIRTAVAEDELDHIVVYGYASPDGPLELNNRLARRRAQTIVNYIIDHASVPEDRIEAQSGGVAWNELHQLVSECDQLPWREQIYEIIDDEPATGAADTRLARLKALARGVPYRWMLRNLFPQLRSSLAVMIYRKADPVGQVLVIETEEPMTNPDEIEEVELVEEVAPDVVEEPDSTVDFYEVEVVGEHIPRYCMAVKTNMLYYAALMPNVEVEYMFNEHWSAAVEWNFAWWGHYDSGHSYRMSVIDAEVRRWIKPRDYLHGMFVGAFAGGGWYDLLKSTDARGNRGEGGMAGLSVGYMWPIGRRLSLEAEVGAGYMYTRYKQYRQLDGHHLYQRTKDLHYWGPLKLKFSIAWRFWDINKSKSTAPTDL